MTIVLVLAVAENGVIGADGALPWRLRSEMRHFRELTLGKPVIMGRRTYASLSRKPLPGRTNIVVTRNREFAAPGVVVTANIDAALAVARGDALRRSADAVMVIGGADIYAQFMPLAGRIVLTRVHASPAGDVFFPPIDADAWQEIDARAHAAGEGDDAAYTILTYARRPATGRDAALR